MSAVAFVTYFVRMPLEETATAGPEMAWLLGIVNTYWTKLVYMNDQETFVAEIQKAQLEFEKSMCLLLKTTDSLERGEAPDSGESACERGIGSAITSGLVISHYAQRIWRNRECAVGVGD